MYSQITLSLRDETPHITKYLKDYLRGWGFVICAFFFLFRVDFFPVLFLLKISSLCVFLFIFLFVVVVEIIRSHIVPNGMKLFKF